VKCNGVASSTAKDTVVRSESLPRKLPPCCANLSRSTSVHGSFNEERQSHSEFEARRQFSIGEDGPPGNVDNDERRRTRRVKEMANGEDDDDDGGDSDNNLFRDEERRSYHQNNEGTRGGGDKDDDDYGINSCKIHSDSISNPRSPLHFHSSRPLSSSSASTLRRQKRISPDGSPRRANSRTHSVDNVGRSSSSPSSSTWDSHDDNPPRSRDEINDKVREI
jgi:hypothetical protein